MPRSQSPKMRYSEEPDKVVGVLPEGNPGVDTGQLLFILDLPSSVSAKTEDGDDNARN